MSHTRKLFSVIIILLNREAKSNKGTSSETFNLLFLISMRLANLKQRAVAPSVSKEVRNNPYNLKIEAHHDGKSLTSSPSGVELQSPVVTQASQASLERLPAELLIAILSHINNQSQLSKISMLSRRLHRAVLPMLYQSPRLTSPSSILAFIDHVEQHSRTTQFVQKLMFYPTIVGSLSNPLVSNPRFDLIPHVHSGLFSVLIHDRDKSFLVHPLFYRLAKTLPNCESVEEHGLHKENSQFLTRARGGKASITRIPSSCATLTFLLRLCGSWYTEYPEWEGMKGSISNCFLTALMLLDWLQGEFNPCWDLVNSEDVRTVKPLIQNKLRSVLCHINSSLLLQVRFITGNSQRLLDCYCLIFYRVLSLARNLDVVALANIMKKEEIQISSNPDLTDIYDSLESLVPLTQNQIAAKKIYEVVILIFHFHIDELRASRDGREIPVDLLREVLLTFPPTSINGETIELISGLIEQVQLDEYDRSSSMLAEWITWLFEVKLWHEASEEVDPVKQILRDSMGKIDVLRGIQRRYGLSFME